MAPAYAPIITTERKGSSAEGASKVLITSCDADVGPARLGGTALRPSDEGAASAGALRATDSVDCTLADGVPATALEGLMAGQAVWFFCGHADASLNGRRTLAFAHPRGFEMVDADTLVQMVGNRIELTDARDASPERKNGLTFIFLREALSAPVLCDAVSACQSSARLPQNV